MDGSSRRSTILSVFDVYSVRIMLGWIASLGLLLVFVHLPLQRAGERIGWGATYPEARIPVTEVEPEESEKDPSSTPSPEDTPVPTVSSRGEAQTDSESPSANKESESAGDSEETTPSSEVHPLTALEVSDRAPEIRGGMGALYFRIDYPEEARKKGIQGRLLLEFTVDTEGQAQSIEVKESLHPLCDSAAVHGIRSVEFVPAKHNGNVVPVRMRLPVRFQLLSDSTGVETAASAKETSSES